MKFKIIAGVLCLLLALPVLSQTKRLTVSGTIKDASSGEDLIGATVYIPEISNGAISNVYGFYSLSMEPGTYTMMVTFVGYQPQKHTVKLENGNMVMNIRLQAAMGTLQEVVITADHVAEKVQSTQMGEIRLPVSQIKRLPTFGGETDIIKVVQLMPGVKRGSEGQNTVLVRGGTGADNLILLDEAVVYNVSHLFGFFSVFNNSVLKDVSLFKGGFPAQYGGRISSIMDIRMKEGHQQQVKGAGSIGILSSNLAIEVPIIKNKMSFLASGRRSYIDQVFNLTAGKNTLPYYFYDANFKLNYAFSDKDRLFVSGYFGDDIFKVSTEAETDEEGNVFGGGRTGFMIGNRTNTIRWNHIFNAKLFSNLSLINTRFRYNIEAAFPGNNFYTKSQIDDWGAKMDLNYYHRPGSTVKFGASAVHHNFRPNTIQSAGDISEFIKSSEGKKISNAEMGIYGNHELDLDSVFKFNYGLRLSGLATKGKFYQGVEPRATFTWLATPKGSVKLNYARMYQYLFLVTNSSVALPTDLWYPVTANLKPMNSDQVAIGYHHNLDRIQSLFTVEAYYKWMRNLVELNEGTVVFLKDDFESELVTGKGEAYGLEFFLQRSSGKLTGWIGYTLSWSWRHFDKINQGKPFLAKYDRRHDFSLVASYDIGKRIAISGVWVYATGQRFTPITGNYMMPGPTFNLDILPIYPEKNSLEMPASHRLDLTVAIKPRPSRKSFYSEWQFGAYNVYNRAQPYKVEVVPDDKGGFKYQAKGLFGVIPFVSYNFNF